tara:strand:+ start:6683 stop:7240 length:558 start_codon:yes stop_codon:yes gene_type:complete
MDLTSLLIGMAAEVGAPLVKDILDNKIGGGSGKLAETVIKSVATSAGTTPAQLPELAAGKPAVVKAAIEKAESIAPELIALYTAGLEGQFKLLLAESAEGPLQSGWRWGWMYLLGLFWAFYVLIFPIVNALLEATGSVVQVKTLEAAILLTLTSWFIALYMGGHTIKELGKSAIDAVRSWKGGPG